MTDQVLDRVWQALDAATTQRTGMTLGFLGTLDGADAPRVRAVILRDFDAQRGSLYFATHAHSEKVAEIHAQPQVALTLYDDPVQLRLRGTVEFADDVERRAAWDALAEHSRAAYASAGVPGQPVNAELVDDPTNAFQRFAWVSVILDHFDWLELGQIQHQRWQGQRTTDGWDIQQVVP